MFSFVTALRPARRADRQRRPPPPRYTYYISLVGTYLEWREIFADPESCAALDGVLNQTSKAQAAAGR